jgi:hypothetical protein
MTGGSEGLMQTVLNAVDWVDSLSSTMGVLCGISAGKNQSLGRRD